MFKSFGKTDVLSGPSIWQGGSAILHLAAMFPFTVPPRVAAAHTSPGGAWQSLR